MGIFDKMKGRGAKKAPAAKKEEAKTEAATASRKGGSLAASVILRRPLFTEKTDRMQAMGKYAFIVSGGANKTEVAHAVRDIYGVTPTAVHMSVIKGKEVRFARGTGRRKDQKKAIVTLKKGEKITVMHGA